MRIGDVAERAGLSARTLRFYEGEGLLPDPGRSRSGYREYDADVLDRLAFIRDSRAAGFTLRQIRQVLEIRDGGEQPCLHVGRLIEDRLAEVEHRIAELDETRRRLQDLARRTAELDPADCQGYCDIIQSAPLERATARPDPVSISRT